MKYLHLQPIEAKDFMPFCKCFYFILNDTNISLLFYLMSFLYLHEYARLLEFVVELYQPIMIILKFGYHIQFQDFNFYYRKSLLAVLAFYKLRIIYGFIQMKIILSLTLANTKNQEGYNHFYLQIVFI